MADALAERREAQWRTALSLVSLSQRLGLHASLERAQEILYLGIVEDGAEVTPIIRELGLALGLAPGVLSAEPATAQSA